MSINFKILQNYPKLKFGLSQISDGPMSLAGSSDFSNREKFFEKKNIILNNIISAKLAHNSNVSLVTKTDAGAVIQNVDGLITKDPNVTLTITVADCYPIYFYDPIQNIIGLVHSGWRGSVSNLITNTVTIITNKPTDLLIGIGPGIGPCHFEITGDVVDKFLEFPNSLEHKGSKIFVNLSKIINSQLIKAGIKRENIEFIGECTFCSKDKYFSYRRDKPDKVQAQIAYITL